MISVVMVGEDVVAAEVEGVVISVVMMGEEMATTEVESAVISVVRTGEEVGAAEVDWWGMGSSASCRCSPEGYCIPACISTPPGMPWEAEKPMMAIALSSSSLRGCAVFTPAPVV